MTADLFPPLFNISRKVLGIALLSEIEFTHRANNAWCFSLMPESAIVFNNQNLNCKHFS